MVAVCFSEQKTKTTKVNKEKQVSVDSVIPGYMITQ